MKKEKTKTNNDDNMIQTDNIISEPVDNTISDEDAEKGFKALTKSIEEKKTDTDELNSKIKYVDLSSIQIEDANVVTQRETVKDLLNIKASVGVVCAQSGYRAAMSSLTYRDIIAITNSSLTNYENKKAIYKVLYSKITSFSADTWHPSFDEWLAATSLGDVETLFYGVLIATFNNNISIKYECPFCGESNALSVNGNELIRVADKKEMMALIDTISREASTKEKIDEFSTIFDNKKNNVNIMLPDSKMIFVVRLPSLADTLLLLKTIPEEKLAEKTTDEINIILSTRNVLLYNKETEKYSYIENKKDIFSLTNILSIEDFAVLKAAIFNMLQDKHITYKLENQKCGYCNKKITELPLDMENLLFFQISKRQLI